MGGFPWFEVLFRIPRGLRNGSAPAGLWVKASSDWSYSKLCSAKRSDVCGV